MPDFEQLVGRVVDAWLRQSKHVTAATIDVGLQTHRAICHHLRRIDDPGERRNVRSDAIDRTVMKLQAVGAKITAAGLRRAVQVGQVAKCFNEAEAKTLPVNVLKVFGGLVVRDKKTEAWRIRDKVLDRANELWSRAVAGEVADVAAAIRDILGRKPPMPRVKKPPASTVERIKTLLPQLTEDGRRSLYVVLAREFGHEVKVTQQPPQGAEVQATVKMPPPPGQVAAQPATIRQRLLGKAG